MKHRARVADFWDGVLESWCRNPSMADLPDLLHKWKEGYSRPDEIDLRCYPEGFLGDLRAEQREPHLIVLGLNPGKAFPELQGPEGEWTKVAKKLTYSRSSSYRVPFGNDAWRKISENKGRDSAYWVRLINFARRWLDDDQAGIAEILNFEMYPFHTKSLNGTIDPPAGIIESLIWAPLREMDANVVFAFGKPWESVCDRLFDKPPIASFGSNSQPLNDATNGGDWRVKVYCIPGVDKRVVVSWQKGYAGPPGKGNVGELRRIVRETGG